MFKSKRIKIRDLTMELHALQEKSNGSNSRSQDLKPAKSLSDELSEANTKIDNFTQTEIEHGCSGQEEIQKESRLLDEGYCDSFQEEKEPELNSEQDYSETNRPYHDQYELIKTEHLSQILCNDPLEILKKQGYSESEIGEICSQYDSWYTQMTMPMLKDTVPPSLMDSGDSLRKQVCLWFGEDHRLTENQEKLNEKLLNIVKYLDWYDEGVLFDYDNGSVYELEEFLEDNKSNPDLKVVVNLRRGESGATVLHAVSGAHIYEVGSNKENRAVSLLLAAGADPNTKNHEGETPLHYAAAIGNSEGVSSLLRGGANSNICDKQGKTPQRVAVDDGHYNVAGLLLTKEQEELRRELYDILVIPVYGPIRFTKTLKEFLDKHKSNQDLKVVLNIRSERGELEVLECARNITYIDKAISAEIRNLFLGAGVSCDVPYCMAGEKRPPVLWYHLMPDQQKKLDSFLGRVSKAEDMDELKKVIDEAIRSGVRLNFNKDLSPGDRIACNWYSLTDYTIKRIGELNKLKRSSKVASDIVCNLVSAGAVLYTRNSIDVIEELELEFKFHKNNIVDSYTCHINNAHKLIKVARSATDGRLNDVRMDNAVFYLEYSEGSTIDAAMITDGVRDQLSQKQVGYRRNIIKIGKSEVEIIKEDGIRNYTNLADNSDIVLIFYTSQGELEVRLFPDTKNKDLIVVKVNNQDLLKQLKNCKEELGKNCLLGGYSVHDAIKRGYFEKHETLRQSSEKITLSNEKKKNSWCEIVTNSKQTTSRTLG
ncbi:ankyrin repeat domain-containing protein [Wolbachia endosymbiont of Drosophila bicornuta]|uniref:ankyrin repeat domain-containing protein n=1 Tax=Wolbachia TaxID=953 RepID=UPI0015FD686B|nr:MULTISPECIES: ankyrin repeat domain-containing protein [Wolbachia]MBA8754953.1 ankryin [Wolbachia pipientis]MDE5056557.1 ankyrin repeat domain-containing protein [Wolbachia endosymbiont of Drosophila bicornuta]